MKEVKTIKKNDKMTILKSDNLKVIWRKVEKYREDRSSAAGCNCKPLKHNQCVKSHSIQEHTDYPLLNVLSRRRYFENLGRKKRVKMKLQIIHTVFKANLQWSTMYWGWQRSMRPRSGCLISATSIDSTLIRQLCRTYGHIILRLQKLEDLRNVCSCSSRICLFIIKYW